VAFQRKKPAAIGVKAPFPSFVEPALASAIDKVPSGTLWVHEIKLDGYRVQVHLANHAIKVFTRRGHDWTHRFKKIAHDAWHIKAGSAVMTERSWTRPPTPIRPDAAPTGSRRPARSARR
jgi:bifunctional non-homologous end joining protein LigD